MKRLAVVLCLMMSLVSTSVAEPLENGWRTSWDGMLYGYAVSQHLRSGSVLNPGNTIARLGERSEVAELRANLKAENETLRLTARPIVSVRATHNTFGTRQENDAYFSQWQLRAGVAEGWNVAAGRDVLNWGPAQFRSPSSPFYFDNGRSDPMSELIGMDSLKASWTPDRQTGLSLARIFRTGEGADRPAGWHDPWHASWLAKLDHRGGDWALGTVIAKAPDRPAFYGAHGQLTLNDALMIYGEIGSSVLARSLQASSDPAQPFTVLARSPRRTTALAGASWTFENGQSLAAEYLHDGHGYTRAQERAYFLRAANEPAIALALRPRLLGRDYVHFVWQSNLMDEDGFWRLMYTRNLTDRGQEISAYGETTLTTRISAYAMAVLPHGHGDQESAALIDRRLILGVKIALP